MTTSNPTQATQHADPVLVDRRAFDEVIGLVTDRFGDGGACLGTAADPYSIVHHHATIHRYDLDERGGRARRAPCGTRIRYVLDRLPAPAPDESKPEQAATLRAQVLATTIVRDYDTCRLCQRCFPDLSIPAHDQWRCYDQHKIRRQVAAVLSPEAVAVIAGTLAPESEVRSEGIRWDDPVRRELMAAFPQEAFWAWADPDNDPDNDPDGMPRYNPDAGF